MATAVAYRRRDRMRLWLPGYGFGMSLRWRVRWGFAIVLAAAVIAIVAIFAGLRATHAADREVSNRWTPAASASDQLLAHLVDQETGERGFLITGDTKLLEPFNTGRAATTQDLAQIRTLAGDVPSISTEVGDVQDQWRLWLTEIANPEIAARTAGNVSQSQQLVDRTQGKTVFDELRARVAVLQKDISAHESAKRESETQAIADLGDVLIATSVVAVIFTLISLFLMSAWVLRPLTELQYRLRAATAGAFRDAIPAGGPPELHEVGQGADLLRLRLLSELEHSEKARQALEQRGPVVLGLSERLRLMGLPVIDGLRIASALHAAEGVVAGDLLDVVHIDETRVAVVIADVSGHGATAGLEGITLKDVIGTALRLGCDPAQALEMAADQSRLDDERFATCAIVIVDVITGALRYANAGHLPPLIVPAGSGALTPDELVSLEPTGPLLSVLGRGWDVRSGQLQPGEMLLLVTDGLLEARTPQGAEFGVDGLCRALSLATVRDVDTVVSALTAAAREHAENFTRDDVTILAVMLDTASAQLEDPHSAGGDDAINTSIVGNSRHDIDDLVIVDDGQHPRG
ncbi:MAG TPA: SpoIIE family protein phosphatase [Acidothermaceae bacterium]